MSVLERCDCTRRLTFQVSSFNWSSKHFFFVFVFVFEILLPQKRELNPLKSFNYHKHQHKGNKVWTVFGFFLLRQSLQLSLFLTQVTISHSYFSWHHRECLFRCFSLHVDSNSLDVTEKSVFGLATYETFRWSVVRASNWYLGYNGLQCLQNIQKVSKSRAANQWVVLDLPVVALAQYN